MIQKCPILTKIPKKKFFAKVITEKIVGFPGRYLYLRKLDFFPRRLNATKPIFT